MVSFNQNILKVLDFSMPLLKAVTPEGQTVFMRKMIQDVEKKTNQNHVQVSLSDHEALLATFLVESKPSPRGPNPAEVPF